MTMPPRPTVTFILHLRPIRSGRHAIRSLRWLLKRLLRQHGMRCISAEEKIESFVHEHEEPPGYPASQKKEASNERSYCSK
jgi:hypothetical protein